MSAEPIARMTNLDGEAIPLTGVHLSGSIEASLLELTVEQHYENRDPVAIEAVYTFPLPMNAVLMSFELEIGARRLAGVVSRKREASETYENAIESGDTAALLEHTRDGLYTVSLGNLQAGERATVRFRFAQLLNFDGGRVRAAIPTALAPRYGNASAAVAAHQVPVTDLTAHYPLTMNLVIRGELARAPISSPTHTLKQVSGAETVELSLGPKAALDRDLVILIDRAQAPSQALIARDGDAYVALATVTAPPTATDEAKPRNLKLLVDCSGSMEGDSIGQASEGLRAVLGSLTSHDKVSLTRFGSRLDQVTRGLEAVTPALKARLAQVIGTMCADLGGTEIGAAIDSVIAMPVPKDATADVLLITDGEVWELDALLAGLADAGHRLFVIAVGAAPVEELGRKVASATGGACEFVTPGEDMRGAVARQLGRMGTPPATVTGVDWSETPDWSVGVGQFVFPGDTVHVFASFREQPREALRVTIGGVTAVASVSCTWPATVAEGDTLARVATARRLPGLETEAAADLAEKYSLVTAQTSCVVVLVRPEGGKSEEMPTLRAVPQMMAAGWSGVGTVPRTLSSPGPALIGEMMCFSRGFSADEQPTSERIVRPLRLPLEPSERGQASDDPLDELRGWVESIIDESTAQVERLRQQAHEIHHEIRKTKDAFEERRREGLEGLDAAHRLLGELSARADRNTAEFVQRLESLEQHAAHVRDEITEVQARLDDRVPELRIRIEQLEHRLRSPPDSDVVAPAAPATVAERLAQFVADSGHLPSTLMDLGSLGFEPRILSALKGVIGQGHREKDVVVAWLAESMSKSQGGALEARLRARLARAATRPLRTLVAGLFP